MSVEACKRKIESYFTKENQGPLFVNVENGADLDAIVSYFNVDGYEIVQASSFCIKDELPRVENLYEQIRLKKSKYLLVGLTSLLRFQGENEIQRVLNILDDFTDAPLVVLTYQCGKILPVSNVRIRQRIFLLEGKTDPLPILAFVAKKPPVDSSHVAVEGVDQAAKAVEQGRVSKVWVVTHKRKEMYECSIYDIEDMTSAYAMIKQRDPLLQSTEMAWGDDEQWQYLYSFLESGKSFVEVCDDQFGSHQSLEMAIPRYAHYADEKKWLYFIALKVFGVVKGSYLDRVVSKVDQYDQLVLTIYENIFDQDPIDEKKEFLSFYRERKEILQNLQLDKHIEATLSFCHRVAQKEAKGIYYLTDLTDEEKEQTLYLLDAYYQDASKEEVEDILSLVYPDLYLYLQDYHYKVPLLDRYFPLYTYSKVINRVLPELEEMVLEQAESREYNALLPPRTAVMDEVDRQNSILYFVDAMGVEYLSFIMEKCADKKLIAEVKVCCAKLPTITSLNKGFVYEFEEEGKDVKQIKALDDIKHDGSNNYDYTKYKQPYHLIKELEWVDKILGDIQTDLARGECQKVILASDHGASRMAVIHETENKWQMAEKGKYSGRSCPVSEVDEQIPYATKENGYWVLANYDRFKGSRRANVEVHGGATLEEIVVPVIEFTMQQADVQIVLEQAVITVSHNKVASVVLLSNVALKDVAVKVNGRTYEAKDLGNDKYQVDMPDLKRAEKYSMQVYAANNIMASDISFEIQKEGAKRRRLF